MPEVADIEQAEKQVLDVVKAADNQLTPADVVRSLRDQTTLPEDGIQAVVWRLIDRDRLQISANWKLHANGLNGA